MTKSKIKQELRRSACEDRSPFFGIAWFAYFEVRDFAKDGILTNLSNDDCRTFFLLVAEAL